MRTPFKLKSSPTKGKLQDFFNSVGANLKRNKKDIGAEMTKKYGGSKQTTNKAGEKIGYTASTLSIKGNDGAKHTHLTTPHNQSKTQAQRSANVAKGVTYTKKQAEAIKKENKKRFKKTLQEGKDAAYYGSAKDKAKNSEANKKTTKAKKKVSYAAAYKNADKKKYPTLALFTTAAKAYNDKKKKKKK